MILMKKSMLVFMSCIFCVFAANAGFLSGLKMTVYYPYQVRTVMPMTGPSVVQCNYADPEITVMFSSDGVPTEAMEKGNSYELEYYDTFDGNDIYTMDENRYISVKSDGACIVDTSTSSFGGQPIYIDYTINDCRGGSSSYGGGYSGGGYDGGSSSSYTTCRICGGSGVCTSCNGRGGEWRSSGYYTGSGSQTWINCPSCNGSKRCFNCHGTGKQ